MSVPEPSHITELLHGWQRGDERATEQLMEVVYDQLRRLASSFLGRERAGHTLQPTALVHEAFARLVEQQGIDWQDRGHFFAMSASVMRRVLVDYARARVAKKRGGGAPIVSFDDLEDGQMAASVMRAADLVALDDSLKRLEDVDPMKSKIVQLRYFGGFSLDEIAHRLECSRATVTRHWRMAKAWLYRDVSGAVNA